MPYATVNGLNMYYEVHGDGPPLLSLHGGAPPNRVHAAEFRPFLGVFASGVMHER